MDACRIIGRVHPYLARICNTWFGMRGSVENTDTTGTAPYFNDPDGSWRRMFITQPPCKCVRVMAETADHTDTDRFIVRYRDDDGVRLGGPYDAMISGWSKDSFKKFDAMAWTPGYSKQGTENEETIVDETSRKGSPKKPQQIINNTGKRYQTVNS